jgi:DNA mismatch repair ATPase MutS
MNVSGIIATHDISLSELEQQFPQHFRNFCFEVSLENDFLFYDYKLREGVCKNLNALLLMRKMGIVN